MKAVLSAKLTVDNTSNSLQNCIGTSDKTLSLAIEKKIKDLDYTIDVVTKGLSKELKVTTHSISNEAYELRHIEKPTHYDFPNLGNKRTLYIATLENVIYRWDEITLTYIKISFNYNDIQIINGGTANG